MASKSVHNLIQRCNNYLGANSLKRERRSLIPQQLSFARKFAAREGLGFAKLNYLSLFFLLLFSCFISVFDILSRKKHRRWVAVILENQTWEMKEEGRLREKARRVIQTSLSNPREGLVWLNWRRSDYMDKWAVATILLFTDLTLEISTR